MSVPRCAFAVLGCLFVVAAGMLPQQASAVTTSCSPDVEYIPAAAVPGGGEPVAFDRQGATLWRFPGDGALTWRSAEGDTQWIGGPVWASQEGTMLPNGVVVGGAYNRWSTHAEQRGFVWADGHMTVLSDKGFGGDYAWASDASPSGVIVGYARDKEDQNHAVYWPSASAKPRVLPTRDGKYEATSAISIDRDGTIYGLGRKHPDEPLGWLVWRGSKVRPFAMPDRFTPREISGGRAAGYVTIRDGSRRPALFGLHGLRVPPLPEGAVGEGSSLTEDGAWGGYVRDDTGQAHGFVAASRGPLQYLDEGPVIRVHAFDGVSALAWADLGDEGDGAAIVRCMQP